MSHYLVITQWKSVRYGEDRKLVEANNEDEAFDADDITGEEETEEHEDYEIEDVEYTELSNEQWLLEQLKRNS